MAAEALLLAVLAVTAEVTAERAALAAELVVTAEVAVAAAVAVPAVSAVPVVPVWLFLITPRTPQLTTV